MAKKSGELGDPPKDSGRPPDPWAPRDGADASPAARAAATAVAPVAATAPRACKQQPSAALAPLPPAAVGDLSKADLEGKVVFVRADLNVSAAAGADGGAAPLRASQLTHTGCPRSCHWQPRATLPSRSDCSYCNCNDCSVPQVPLDGDLNITDDTRIRAAVPTLKYLTDNGAKVGIQ